MYFLADNFWKFVLIACVAFGGLKFYEKHKTETAWALSTGKFASSIYELQNARLSSGQVTTWESNFWKLLLKTDETLSLIRAGKIIVLNEENKPSDSVEPEALLRRFLEASASKAGLSSSGSREGNPVRLLTNSLIETYRHLDTYGIWTDNNSLREMAKGLPPTVVSGPFAGEKAELVRRISPQLFRDGIFQVCNVQVLPKPAAAMFMPEVDDKMRDLAFLLKEASIMDKRSFEAVDRMFQQNASLAQ